MNQLKMPYTGPIAGVAKTIDIVDSTGVYTVPEADKGTRYLIRKSNAIADIYAIKATNAVFTRKRLTSLHFNRQDDFFLIEKGDGDEASAAQSSLFVPRRCAPRAGTSASRPTSPSPPCPTSRWSRTW